MANIEPDNCIYLLYRSDIGQFREKIFKYGRTCTPETRFFGYPKNSTIIYLWKVRNCYYVEDEIDKLFKERFTRRLEFGLEYFETDDVRHMINEIDDLIDRIDQKNNNNLIDKLRDVYKNRLKIKICDKSSDTYTQQLIEDYADDDNDYMIKKKKENFNVSKIRKIINSHNNNEIKEKILYGKEKCLTTDEKIILSVYKARADYFKIDYNKKCPKKRYKEFIIDTDTFTRQFLLRLLLISDYQIDDDIILRIREYNILCGNMLLTKIDMIKQLEKIFNINLFKIDTKLHIDSFNNEVIVPDILANDINKIFRVTKKNMNDKINTFKYWYYQLVNMYKNILGNDIFIYVACIKNYCYYYSYSINDSIFNKHTNLFSDQIKISDD